MTNYDNFAHTFSKSRQDHPWPELDYIISDIYKQGYTSVLDVGCGNGRFLEQMERGTWNVRRYLGVDNSAGMIEEARRLHPEYRFEVCDMLSLLRHREGGSDPVSGKQSMDCFVLASGGIWDAVVFLASFHHLETREERIQVLYDVKKLLTPGGRAYMTNWNLREQPKYEKSHRGGGDFDIKIGAYSRYYHGFTLSELEELFAQVGYGVVQNRVWEGGRNMVSVIRCIEGLSE